MAQRVSLQIAGAFLSLIFSSQSALAEPAYCDPKRFEQTEQDVKVDGTKRLHVFQVGQLTLAGVAVGKAEPAVLQAMAQEFAGVSPASRSCTWYFNDGNDEASQVFNWRYVPRPYPWSGTTKTADKYQTALASTFADDPINMVECAIDYGYIAMGCDGMKHRGPSVFAMLLAYSGCSPENSNKIANEVWGLNTVPSKIRLEIARRGYELGNKNPRARAALQQVMTSEPAR